MTLAPVRPDGGSSGARAVPSPGSREPDPQAVPALTGFDPSRPSEHMGDRVRIDGLSGVARGGSRRHARDTDKTLCLTLYDQSGEMQELMVSRTRDMEVFQEWLRKFDRYAPRPRDSDEHPTGEDANASAIRGVAEAGHKEILI